MDGVPERHSGKAPGAPLTALLGAACISSSAVLVTLSHSAAGTVAFFRCAIGFVVLVPLALAEERRLGRRRPIERLYGVTGGLLLGIDLVLWNHAITDVGAGIATVLGNLQVVFVALIAWFVLRERPGLRFVVSLPVVLGGVALAAGLLGHGAQGDDPLGGIVYGIGTSIAYAGFILVQRTTAAKGRHVATPLAEASFGAAAASLVIGLVVGEMSFTPDAKSLMYLAILAVTSQVVGWLLITSALPRLQASLAALLLLFQPASSLLLAWLILGEGPTALQLLGALAVCAGVALAASGESRSRAPLVEPTPG